MCGVLVLLRRGARAPAPVISITATEYPTQYHCFYKPMTQYPKLVAAALVLVMLVLPAAAQVSCSRHMAGMGKHDSHAAMMGMLSPPVSVSGAGSSACCEISPAESIAAPLYQAPISNAANVVPALASSIFQAPQAVEFVPPPALPRVPGPLPQALLCVFLI